MIFKKSALQGNFILSNGTPIVFIDGYYETENESEIAQLSGIYEKVDAIPAKESGESAAPEQPAGAVGTVNTAALANLIKK